jgi:hypothetical protein
VLEGPFSWSMPAKEKGAKVAEHRGMQITGAGHDVCYNRVRGFKDAIDTFPLAPLRRDRHPPQRSERMHGRRHSSWTVPSGTSAASRTA